MSKIKKEQSLEEYLDAEPKADRKYTKEELQQFHDLTQKYYFDYVLVHGKNAGETIRVLDKEKLMVAYGAITAGGEIILTEIVCKDKSGAIKSYKKPTRLAEFDNLFNQWQWWKVNSGADKVWGSKKYEQLDEIAEQMTMPHTEEQIWKITLLN